MTKTIKVEGQEIQLKTNGLVPILYKREFGKDLFMEINKIGNGSIDIEFLMNVTWMFAKIADADLPDLDTWYSSFETFPIADYSADVIELLTKCFATAKKNSPAPKKVVKK